MMMAEILVYRKKHIKAYRGHMRKIDLTEGNITKTMILFALPMILGNLLQQMYNIADTLIVGRFLGAGALAAVGSAYALMTFLTSVLLGLCMGSGAVFSICWGGKNTEKLKSAIFTSFVLTAVQTVILNVAVFLFIDEILALLNVPSEIYHLMRGYVQVIFWGIGFVFLYNFFAALLRAVGNSVVPLIFLAVCAALNVILDLYFVLGLGLGVKGAAAATVISQAVSGLGIGIYTWVMHPDFRPERKNCRIEPVLLKEMAQFSVMTSIQQSVMNLGILMVQGLVNSFGTAVMAAFAAAVKIDSFAYMPVQDFGNAFSTFIAQNYGARKEARIREGIVSAVKTSMVFGLVVSLVIWVFAKPLMMIFVNPGETAILVEGVRYLRIEGAFYFLIGLLFLLYGFFRAIERPGMSVVLTVVSLGLRVVLAYTLSAIPALGVTGIWVSIPIGWLLADITGVSPMMKFYKKLEGETR